MKIIDLLDHLPNEYKNPFQAWDMREQSTVPMDTFVSSTAKIFFSFVEGQLPPFHGSFLFWVVLCWVGWVVMIVWVVWLVGLCL